jgi:F5/8 type C domain
MPDNHHGSLRTAIAVVAAMTVLSPVVHAQPSMSRGQQELPVGNAECLRRAGAAMAAEGFSPGGAGNFAQGFRGDSGAYIICNDSSAQQSVVNIVVASLSQDSGVPGSVRQALQARMAGAVPGGGGGSANLALNRPARQSSTSQWSTQNDAQGAVNGVRNGSFGFHTNNERNPWWEVDLQRNVSLAELRLYNRRDYGPERASTIQVLVSSDGANYSRVYAHNGSSWGGDGTPLVVPMNGATARWVRLQLNAQEYLHLDEVEVIGR